MAASEHDRHRDRGYEPEPAWSLGQRAYLEDLITSLMCRAEVLEREARRMKIKLASVLERVRGGSG
jgi:hypothetical protein